MRIDEIAVGMAAERLNEVTAADIQAFAEVSGDDNPIHLDPDYAAASPFKGCIAHGILSAAFISAVLGTQLPGRGSVYLGQTLKFRSPVRPGDQVVTQVRVRDVVPDKRRVVLDTVCRVGERCVLEGEATLLLPA
jgi:3-hydroxybutyryl-CoA dehydratase